MTQVKPSMYTVSSLTQEIKNLLGSHFLHVRVKGEVSNLRKQQSGHIYFSLKDKNAQISAVIFQGYAKSMGRIPKDGDQITLEGEISVYAPRGSYQIIGRRVEFDGIGDLLLKLQELKEALKAKGYFDSSRKKPLPVFPKTIGVITSPSGAVIRDIIHVLERRTRGFHLILNPVSVQGPGAAEEISRAIDDMNRYNLADVLIVGRGGGSLEDLWPFNEECVADAVFRSKIPIVSAVGHETDYSICDFVADVRAPTPSAAAEIISKERSALIEKLVNYQKAFDQTAIGRLERLQLKLDKVASHPAIADPYFLTQRHIQNIDHHRNKFDRGIQYSLDTKKLSFERLAVTLRSLAPSQAIRHARARLASYSKQIETLRSTLQTKRERLMRLSSHLNSLNPKNVLKKGYCIVFSENRNSVMMSTSDAKVGDTVKLQFHDGSAEADVTRVQKDNK